MPFIVVVLFGAILVGWLGSGAIVYSIVVVPIVLCVTLPFYLVGGSGNYISKTIGGVITLGGTALVIRSVAESSSDGTDQFVRGFIGLFLIAICVIVGGYIMYVFNDEL